MFSSLSLWLFLTIRSLLSEIKSSILIIPFSANVLKQTELPPIQINLLFQRIIFARSFSFKPCTLPLFAPEHFAKLLNHKILVALSAISAIQSCSIKLISRQQALDNAEEFFSKCSADHLPISYNKVSLRFNNRLQMWGFQSSIFDFTDKSRTLNFILSLPNKIKNNFICLLHKILAQWYQTRPI